MKKYSFFLLMLASFLLAACSSDEPEVPVEPTPPPVVDEHVSFSATLSGMSRATDTNFDQGDEISVFSVESSGSDDKGIIANNSNYADNVKYYYKGNKFTSSNGILIENNKKKYYYHAVYPYVSNAANKFKFTVKADQRGNNYTLSDLSTAHTSATSDLLVPLKFSHRLSKLVIELQGDNWPAADLSFKIKNVKTSANVDLNSLNFAPGNEKGDIIFAENGTKSYKVIIPPQSFKEGDELIEATIGGKKIIIKVKDSFDIHSGQQKTLSFTYSQDKGLVEFTGDINPWEEDDSLFDDLIPESVREKIESHMPIHRGNNPPKIDNVFILKELKVSYSSSSQVSVGTSMSTTHIRFTSQTSTTIHYEAKSEKIVDSGTAFISGHGNYFTTCIHVTRMTFGIKHKVAVLISGEKTSTGIKDLHYTEIMIEKGSDVKHLLIDINVFVIYRTTTICVISEWPGVKVDDIIPKDIRVKVGKYITIYDGVNPPDIQGTYVMDPMSTVFCEDGYFEPGKVIASNYLKFYNQNFVTNQLDFAQKQHTSSSEAKGAYISGYDNYFTAFFNTIGVSQDIATKRALVISGQKTKEGIKNIKYAFIMVEKGPDPKPSLMEVGVFRVFEDADGLAANTTWSKSFSLPKVSKGRILWCQDTYVK